MKPEIPKLTKAQKERAVGRVEDLHEVLTRIMVVMSYADADSAFESDPDVFSDARALLSDITGVEYVIHSIQEGESND